MKDKSPGEELPAVILPTASLIFLRALVHVLQEEDPAILEKIRNRINKMKSGPLGENFPASMGLVEEMLEMDDDDEE